MENLPAIMADGEPDVEDTKGGSWNREEIHRRDDITVIPQECFPFLDLVFIRFSPWNVSGDCAL